MIEQSGGPYRAGIELRGPIVVTTANDIAGHRISTYLGVVRGIVVRSPHVGHSLLGALKSLGGGQITEFTRVCEAARHEAYAQMLENAESLGADAIIAMRYDATEFMSGITEVLAYGTAVNIEPLS